MGTFNLTVDSIGITQTRSKHEDTNYLGLLLRLGSLDPMFTIQPLNDMNNGNHVVDVSIPGFDFGQDDILAFNYLVVNAGSTSPDQARAVLKAAQAAWLSGTGPVPPPPAPHLASANGIDTDYLVAQLAGILRSSCDGIVAAEQNQLVFSQLPISHLTSHPGTHSPSGCGNNSQYTVQWHIAPAQVMPPLQTKQDADNLKNAGFNVHEAGTGLYVQNQNPQAGVWIDSTTNISVALGTKKPIAN
ncbi:hypothetical protein [Terriglobus roseus]|uniref:Uncharacterized protein n=1 Tax=Terriglobus roseus TaxID=392734 RepID=A0A1G7H7K9_9BACT|nr:hypothetical protein [Terriglobus roseus]SDE96386.1 hypothetical protein SAMN05444167_0946 [Terriglobus roseus]